MRPPYRAGELASVTGVPVASIRDYTSAGLLDPDQDGAYDDYDVLRCRLLSTFPADAAPGDVVEAVRRGELDHVHADLLFGASRQARSVEQLAAETGLSPAEVRQAQAALGVLGAPSDTDAVPVLAQLTRARDLGIPWSAILDTLVVLGEASRRVSVSAAGTVHEHLHASLGDPVDTTVSRHVRELSQQLMPVMRDLAGYALHQHMLRATAEDALAHTAQGQQERPVTILFADLALFTALTDVHGDRAAAEILRTFEDITRELAVAHHGTPVKQIGDEFMLAFDDPADAVRFACELHDRGGVETNFPALRIGINCGPVVARLGDYFGQIVNVASRLAAMTGPGETWMTQPVAEAARAAGVPVTELGVQRVRGVHEPVELFAAGQTSAPSARDPVCGMLLGEAETLRLSYDGRELRFCSDTCARRYLEHPDQYAADAST